jgi:hypothetical protein
MSHDQPAPPLSSGGSEPVEDQVLAAYAAGKPTEAIAGWFGIGVDQVEQIVAGRTGDGDPVPPAVMRRKRRPLLLVTCAAATLVLITVGGILWAGLAPDEAKPAAMRQGPTLGEAKKKCAVNEAAVTVEDEGKTLLFDGSGKEDWGKADTSVLACILGELKTPQAVIAHMDTTNALAGRQEDSWEGFTASWTYHPDNGMDVIIRAS